MSERSEVMVKPLKPTLRFDRGTLLLEGLVSLPAELEAHFRYDARVDAWRASCEAYFEITPQLGKCNVTDAAPDYRSLALAPSLAVTPYAHQTEAFAAWTAAGGRGVVTLPTGAGKTLVGIQALAWAGVAAMTIVPTIDLMHQWYALLKAAFPDLEIGLLGGGYHDKSPLLVATYDSAARHMERLGNRYGMLVFDEAHHLPADFYRVAAEFSLAPFRLGLTATPERADNREVELTRLIGPFAYRREAAELAGDALAPFTIRRVTVELSAQERIAYEAARGVRDGFLRANNLRLGGLQGWSRFVMLSARSPEGRQAMRAHQELRRLSHAAPAKLRALELILAEHPTEKTLIFTEDNATAYGISRRFLIPCLTHQTLVKERHEALSAFLRGEYRALVTSKVLNEGVDAPDASVGVILSGSSVRREFVQRLGRLLRRREGKRAVLYEVVAVNTREESVAARRRPDFALRAQPNFPTDPNDAA
jgi:superfamily II DNA or RNA helicase